MGVRIFESGAVNRTAILKAVAVAAVFAVMFCVGCGDKSTGGGGGGGGGEKRSAYLITFEPNGGTLTYYSDTTGADGTLDSLPTPEYEGYTFNGWFTADTGDAKVDTNTVFDKADTVYAQWTLNKYAAAFDSRGGGAVDTQSIEHGGKAALPTAPTRANYTFGGWYKDTLYTAAWDFAADTVTSAITLYAKWTPNKYAVTFVDYDETVLKSDTVDYNTGATAPTPTRTGYTFASWDKAFSAVTENLTVTAAYEINKYIVKFVDYDGTTVLKSDTVNYNTGATAPTPTRTGYTFKNWDKAFSAVTENLTVTAEYETNKYIVKFVGYDEAVLKSDTVDYNTGAAAPTPPTHTGYTFASWDKAFSAVTENLTVTAEYEISKYTIKFVGYDGTTVLKQTVVDYNTGATAPTPPARAGWTFTNWDKAYSAVTENLTVTAVYEINRYAVTFDPKGGGAVSAQNIEHGGKITEPPDPTRADYNFDGWFKEAACANAWDFDTGTVTSAVTLYAKWTQLIVHVVTFDPQGGSAVSPHHVEHGDKTPEPADPILAGYNFDGWYKDASCDNVWDFDVETVTDAVTLYAKWTKIEVHVVLFNSRGGSLLNPQHIEHGGKAVEHPTTRDGYTFGGWFREATYINQWIFAADAVTTNITLYAKWTPITYNITYDLDGGAVSSANPTSYTAETAGFTLTRPTKTGWTFEGWTGTGITSPPQKTVSIPQGNTGDRAYTATWSFDPTFVDKRNNKTYKKVLIDTQVWMGENLNYNTGDSRCWGDGIGIVNDRQQVVTLPAEEVQANCEKYGRLYTTGAMMNGESSSSSNPSGVRGACPVGWHVPSYAEWQVLIDYAGGASTAGKKLKSTEVKGTDDYGFSALPGGMGTNNSTSGYLGTFGRWWTSTTGSTAEEYLIKSMMGVNDVVEGGSYGGTTQYSVRCVQD